MIHQNHMEFTTIHPTSNKKYYMNHNTFADAAFNRQSDLFTMHNNNSYDLETGIKNVSVVHYLSMLASIWFMILYKIIKSFKLLIFILLSLYWGELTFVHAQSNTTKCLSMSVTV
eukprot:143709_1